MTSRPTQSHEVREAFLSFFESRGHLRVPSSPLVPQGDPTLLLTNAGMVQFKPYFTGERVPPSPRLASVQKCFRTTDIDVVGDYKHLTLFEMLGNFSIGGYDGSYFKAEAIAWAWEFVTEILKLPAERLWATVYLDDDEAWELWRARGVPPERMRRYGEKENFWGPPGDSGPCGPCSEVHYDYGGPCRNGLPDDQCGPACDCGRFIELWNLVFTQYHQATDGSRRPLDRKNIDTGAGLERMAMVLQGVTTPYDTDAFRPLIAAICERAGVSYGHDPKRDRAIRVAAEHGRAASFLIADGIIPSNAGRGYVLRRIIRRAVRFGLTLELREPFLGRLAEVVTQTLGPFYPELVRNAAFVQQVLLTEEEKFHQTLETGLELLEEELVPFHVALASASKQVRTYRDLQRFVAAAGGRGSLAEVEAHAQRRLSESQRELVEHPANRMRELAEAAGQDESTLVETLSDLVSVASTVSGAAAFRLHDTYGFPIELTADVAAEHGLSVDREGFERALAAQREVARAASAGRFGTGAAAAEALATLALPPTTFVGYTSAEHRTSIAALLAGPEVVESAEEGQEVHAVLLETPFYPEGGGQVGDTGEIVGEHGRLVVVDTQRPGAGLVLHRGIIKGRLRAGEAVVARVDAARRAETMRHHTATHLLHAALRQVLGTHATQAGSLVAPERLRFDFNHLAPLTPEELRRVEDLVNEKLLTDLPVHYQEKSYAAAVAEGALAFFGEKYGDKVRVVEVCDSRPPAPGDPCEHAFSKELCGGTHCTSTAQVGLFLIASETGVGAGLRRIEAVAGRAALELARQRQATLEAAAKALRSGPEQLPDKVAALLDDLDRERRRAMALERELLKSTLDSLLSKVQRIDGVQLVAARVPAGSTDALRQMGDWLRDRLESVVVVLGALINDRPNFVAMVTPDLIAKGYHAGEILKAVAAVAGGGGGGRPEMAQAGGKDKAKLDDALRRAEQLVRERAAPKPGG